jgi:heme-degrading monooxygenase HmoA
MFAVIFVVRPKAGRKDDYLDLAKYLRPMLERVDGFIDNERFESTRTDGNVLSLSTWRDEKAVIRWRTQAEHHDVQEKGRFEVFEDYHLRVGEIMADSHPPPGLSIEQTRIDETVIGEAKVCTITEVSPSDKAVPAAQPTSLPAHLGLDASVAGLLDHEVFRGITIPGKLVMLADWKDAGAADAWAPRAFLGVASLRHRSVRVVRVYGMRERREAPQYYREVPPSGGQRI